ncbi:MFS transporter [Pedobacter sp. PAMC26386]|nr:MFS transporter [Pedobacter sp. PAMC26386]
MNKIKYIAALGIFGIITTEFGVIGILPQIAKHYDIGMDRAGWLLSGFALVIAVCGPWITLAASRFDRKKMMVIALLLFVVSNILSALAPPFWLLLLARILPAFLHPLYFSAAIYAAVTNAPVRDRHKATAVIFGGVSIATVLGVPMTTYFAEVFNWQTAFLCFGVINILAVITALFFIPPMHSIRETSFRTQIGLLGKPVFLLQAITTSLMIAGMFAVYGYFAEFMEKVNHLNGVQISKLLLLFGILGVAGNWVAGKLLSKSLAGTFIFALLLLAVIYILLYFTNGYNIYTIALTAIWGFVHTACFIIGQSWISSAAKGAEEFANSLGVAFTNLGIALGTTISGWIIINSGIQYTVWASIGFIAAALLLAMVKLSFFRS